MKIVLLNLSHGPIRLLKWSLCGLKADDFLMGSCDGVTYGFTCVEAIIPYRYSVHQSEVSVKKSLGRKQMLVDFQCTRGMNGVGQEAE